MLVIWFFWIFNLISFCFILIVCFCFGCLFWNDPTTFYVGQEFIILLLRWLSEITLRWWDCCTLFFDRNKTQLLTIDNSPTKWFIDRCADCLIGSTTEHDSLVIIDSIISSLFHYFFRVFYRFFYIFWNLLISLILKLSYLKSYLIL